MKPDPARFIARLVTAACLTFISALASPAPAADAIPTLDPQDGDTLVFLGDSITHQCLYTQYVEDFFYTRYPDRKIHFHNAGVSGDRAADALARFEDDVTPESPKFVSIMLGMNDGEYQDFNGVFFETYTTGMTEIISRIQGLKATPILMTPTMFDHHQLAIRMQDDTYRFGDREFSGQYNSLMAFYGGWAREQAGEKRLPFVNLWGPLNDITFDERSATPDFTLIPDVIHPGAAGQVIMAFSMLSDLQPDRRNVSSIIITRQEKGWRAATAKTGEVKNLEVSPENDHVTFTFTARALPWVLPAEATMDENSKWEDEPPAAMGYDLTKAGHKLSQETFRVAGLKPGQYRVLIDGVDLGQTFSHITLGSKIELQKFLNTPQSQQALEVAKLNRERNDLAVRPLRNLWSRVKGLRKRYVEIPEPEEGEEPRKAEPETFAAEYEKLKPQIEELKKLARDYEDRIYEINQPKPLNYEVILTKPEKAPAATR